MEGLIAEDFTTYYKSFYSITKGTLLSYTAGLLAQIAKDPAHMSATLGHHNRAGNIVEEMVERSGNRPN